MSSMAAATTTVCAVDCAPLLADDDYDYDETDQKSATLSVSAPPPSYDSLVLVAEDYPRATFGPVGMAAAVAPGLWHPTADLYCPEVRYECGSLASHAWWTRVVILTVLFAIGILCLVPTVIALAAARW